MGLKTPFVFLSAHACDMAERFKGMADAPIAYIDIPVNGAGFMRRINVAVRFGGLCINDTRERESLDARVQKIRKAF